MRRNLCSALLASFLILGTAPPTASAGPKTVARNDPLPAALQIRIRKAIEKGVAYQRKEPPMDIDPEADAEERARTAEPGERRGERR